LYIIFYSIVHYNVQDGTLFTVLTALYSIEQDCAVLEIIVQCCAVLTVFTVFYSIVQYFTVLQGIAQDCKVLDNIMFHHFFYILEVLYITKLYHHILK